MLSKPRKSNIFHYIQTISLFNTSSSIILAFIYASTSSPLFCTFPWNHIFYRTEKKSSPIPEIRSLHTVCLFENRYTLPIILNESSVTISTFTLMHLPRMLKISSSSTTKTNSFYVHRFYLTVNLFSAIFIKHPHHVFFLLFVIHAPYAIISASKIT